MKNIINNIAVIVITSIVSVAGTYLYNNYLSDKPELVAEINHQVFDVPKTEVLEEIISTIGKNKDSQSSDSDSTSLQNLKKDFLLFGLSLFNYSSYLEITLINNGNKRADDVTVKFPIEVSILYGDKSIVGEKFTIDSIEPKETVNLKIWSSDLFLGSSKRNPIYISHAEGAAKIVYNSLENYRDGMFIDSFLITAFLVFVFVLFFHSLSLFITKKQKT